MRPIDLNCIEVDVHLNWKDVWVSYTSGEINDPYAYPAEADHALAVVKAFAKLDGYTGPIVVETAAEDGVCAKYAHTPPPEIKAALDRLRGVHVIMADRMAVRDYAAALKQNTLKENK
jgi:hypothetical protein